MQRCGPCPGIVRSGVESGSGSSIELSAVLFRGVLLALRGGAPLRRGASLGCGDARLEKRKEDYPYVQPEAPVLDVVVVEEHLLFYGGVPPEPVDLRPARDAALDLVAVGITVYRLFEQGYVSGLLGGRRKTPKSRGKVQGAPVTLRLRSSRAPRRPAGTLAGLSYSVLCCSCARHRSSSGSQLRSLAPEYADCGRMRRSWLRCSKQCAVQPATRPMAKVGVKSSVGRPSPCRSSAV